MIIVRVKAQMIVLQPVSVSVFTGAIILDFGTSTLEIQLAMACLSGKVSFDCRTLGLHSRTKCANGCVDRICQG